MLHGPPSPCDSPFLSGYCTYYVTGPVLGWEQEVNPTWSLGPQCFWSMDPNLFPTPNPSLHSLVILITISSPGVFSLPSMPPPLSSNIVRSSSTSETCKNFLYNSASLVFPFPSNFCKIFILCNLK
ncbi:hypothetical protein HJG60_011551 [Phyllostomus discolor]|uniref:Uncharacterized protein n=1 Tax=Phyllostomus discolor TaxID=89673 RepID=A0A834DXF7_9CHIR|nr:hypothetical protein HJG60_011551 [Phyllostomus discolor]